MTDTTTSPSRRGSIYILVLVSALIVTLIGIIGFRLAHTQAAVARADAQRDEATSLAESAVQWGIHYVMLADDWRDETETGDTVRSMSLGGGTISVVISDADGDLDDSDTDTFTITGTATLGSATQTLSVDLAAGTYGAHPALSKSITVGGILYANPTTYYFQSGGTATSHLRTNNAVVAPAGVTIADPVDVPDPGLIDLWIAKGTVIPRSLHNGVISGATFSKTAAPFSVTPDPGGIYIIDADGQNVSITNTTSTGTIVVADLGAATLTATSTHFYMGTSGGPSLIADGDTTLALGGAMGLSNGLFYIDGNVNCTDYLFLEGALFATGNVTVNSPLISISNSTAATSGPPDGFVEVTDIAVIPGTWRRIVN